MVVRDSAAQPYRICSLGVSGPQSADLRGAREKRQCLLARRALARGAEYRETRENHRAKPEQARGDLTGPTIGSVELWHIAEIRSAAWADDEPSSGLKRGRKPDATASHETKGVFRQARSVVCRVRTFVRGTRALCADVVRRSRCRKDER